MNRTARIAAIVFGIFVFLGISFMLTRALTGSNAERSQILKLLSEQAAGDADAVLDRLSACNDEPSCAKSTATRVRGLKRGGEIEILSFEPSVRMAMTEQIGSARVAWQVRGSSSPVVQCVRVRRTGPLAGARTELLAISAPIAAEGSC